MRIRFFALAALALLLGACTQDEAGFLPEGAEGTSIVFTATGLNPVATAIAGTRAPADGNWEGDRKSTRLNSSHIQKSRMPSSA